MAPAKLQFVAESFSNVAVFVRPMIKGLNLLISISEINIAGLTFQQRA